MSEWHDKGAILPLGLKQVLKQGMKIFGVSVNWKWDRLVTYWLALVDCGYSLEPYRRDGSNEYPQYMFLAEIRKIMYTPVNPSFTI